MKYITLLTAVVLLSLGACHETEYIEVEKLIHDTLKVQQFVDRYFSHTDTVSVPVYIDVPVPVRNSIDSVIITKYDTIYYPVYDTIIQKQIIYVDRVDSVFITHVVYEHDTIATTQTIHYDTLFVWSGGRGVYSVPRELQEYVNYFYDRAAALNIPTTGPGWLIIEVQPIDKVLQAYSFTFWWQWSIVVNDRLPIDQMFIPVLREMLRKELGKEYSADPQNPMNPFYPMDKIRWSNRAAFKNEIDSMFL